MAVRSAFLFGLLMTQHLFRIFFFPPSISACSSSRVFFLGFVMVGRSFLIIGKRKEQAFSCVKIAALSWCILLLSRRYLPDKLEVDVYLLVNLPNSANKAAANIHSTKISVSAIKSAEKIHPITSDKTGMIIANIR